MIKPGIEHQSTTVKAGNYRSFPLVRRLRHENIGADRVVVDLLVGLLDKIETLDLS